MCYMHLQNSILVAFRVVSLNRGKNVLFVTCTLNSQKLILCRQICAMKRLTTWELLTCTNICCCMRRESKGVVALSSLAVRQREQTGFGLHRTFNSLCVSELNKSAVRVELMLKPERTLPDVFLLVTGCNTAIRFEFELFHFHFHICNLLI